MHFVKDAYYGVQKYTVDADVLSKPLQNLSILADWRPRSIEIISEHYFMCDYCGTYIAFDIINPQTQHFAVLSAKFIIEDDIRHPIYFDGKMETYCSNCIEQKEYSYPGIGHDIYYTYSEHDNVLRVSLIPNLLNNAKRAYHDGKSLFMGVDINEVCDEKFIEIKMNDNAKNDDSNTHLEK